MKTLSHTLIHCRTIPYLITWPEDPSRLSPAIAYLNTCGSSTPPLDQLRLLLLRLYPSAMWDKSRVYPKIETDFALKPDMYNIYVEAFNNQTFRQDGNESVF